MVTKSLPELNYRYPTNKVFYIITGYMCIFGSSQCDARVIK